MATEGIYKMMWDVLYKAVDAMGASAVDNDNFDESACYVRVLELMDNLCPENVVVDSSIQQIEKLIERDIEEYKHMPISKSPLVRAHYDGAMDALAQLLCEIDEEFYGNPW